MVLLLLTDGFVRDQESPSASIVLKLAGDLDSGQVRAIRHLVASAVGGLKASSGVHGSDSAT